MTPRGLYDEQWFRDTSKGCAWVVVLALMVLAAMVVGMLIVRPAAAAEHGKASWYWQPQRLACPGISRLTGRGDPRLLAAHRTLPCGTKVRVHRGERSVVVTIADRGPFIHGRVIDLFPAGARALAMTKAGVVPVWLERL